MIWTNEFTRWLAGADEYIKAWLSADASLSILPAWFTKPGLYVLSALGLVPHTRGWVMAASLATAYGWTTAARLLWCILGRWAGLYNPNHYRFWLWVPWRPFWRVWIIFLIWREQVFSFGKKATGGWAGWLTTQSLLFKPGELFVGRLWGAGKGWYQPIGINGPRHLAMIAGTGGGKTTLLIAMLALHRGTAFVIDPKGQIARVIAGRMGQGGEGVIGKGMTVRIIDPYRLVNGQAGACWNVFDELTAAEKRHGADAAVRYAVKIADGLIMRYPRENPFWPGTSKDFIPALMLHMRTTEPPEKQNLVRLYELLCNGIPERTEEGKNPFSALLREMSKNAAYGGIIAASARSLADAGNETYGNVLISMREQLKWLKLPEIRSTLTRSDFTLGELKTGKLVLFACAPTSDIKEALAGYFRLLSVLTLYVFENIPGRMKNPCLVALDEMPSLGKIEAVATAAPVLRSFGVRLVAISQDINLLQAAYTDTWASFLSNAEAVFWMGQENPDTLAYLQQKLGTVTRKEKIDGGWFSKIPARYQMIERPLMYPDQLRRFLDPVAGNIVLTRFGKRPLRLKNAAYFKGDLPVCFYDADTDYAERFPRALTRQAFAWALPFFTAKPPLSYDVALQMFGLSEPYTRLEVEARFECLKPSAAKNAEFAATAAGARRLLIRKLERGAIMARARAVYKRRAGQASLWKDDLADAARRVHRFLGRRAA